MNNVRISGGLLACLVAVSIQVSPQLFLPGPLSREAGQEAWLAVLIAGAAGSAVGLFSVWVSLRNGGRSPAIIARTAFGKWIGGLLTCVYAGLFALFFGLTLRDVLDFSITTVLPGTPGLVIVILFAGLCLYAVWQGLEPTARVAFQTIVFLNLIVLSVPLLEAKEFDIKQIDPFLYRGFGSVLRAALIAAPWFAESIFVMSLVPHLKEKRRSYRWYLIGMGIGLLNLTVLVAQALLVFGSTLPQRFLFPIYYMLHLISIARIIERVELLLVTVWLSGMFIKGSLFLYVSAEALAQAFGLKSHRWLAVALAVAGVVFTQMWSSMIEIIQWNSAPATIVSLLSVHLGFPLLLLAGSAIHRALKGRDRAHA